jgi:hypothetical protein
MQRRYLRTNPHTKDQRDMIDRGEGRYLDRLNSLPSVSKRCMLACRWQHGGILWDGASTKEYLKNILV